MKKLSFEKIFLFIFLAVVIFLSAFDLIHDYKSSPSYWHLLGEAFILFLSSLIFLKLSLSIIKFRKENIQLGHELNQSKREASHWKSKNESILKGFSQAIEDQFNLWQLTDAEKEVGLLLLKGFSLKEIAELRKVSERTVRQQSIEIYRKSNLSGRAEFAAFFLDDLMIA